MGAITECLITKDPVPVKVPLPSDEFVGPQKQHVGLGQFTLRPAVKLPDTALPGQ
jgi:hypothetical protein